MKKFISLITIMSLVSLSVPALATDTTAFPDLYNDNPNLNAVTYLKDEGVVSGYPDGKFKPDTTINRAEFTKIVVESLFPDFEPSNKNCFKDVKEESWYASYVCTAKQKNIIEGYPDGTFKPNQNINLAEGSKIITKAFNIKAAAASGNDPWYKNYLEGLETKKAIPVSIDYVDKKLTRGEMSEMIWRLKTRNTDRPGKSYEALTANFPTLESCAELKEKVMLYKYQQNARSRAYYDRYDYVVEEMAMEADSAEGEGEAAMESSAPSGALAPATAQQKSTAASDEYSKTNVQVEGVDEADVIKNDGEFIYIVKGRTVRIVKAYPAEELVELDKLELDDANFSPREIYNDGDTLVVIGSSYQNQPIESRSSGMAIYPYYSNKTKVYVFDMSNRADLIQKRVVSFDGNEVSSRRIGDRLYVIMNDYMPYYSIQEDMPIDDIIPQMLDSKVGETQPVVPCDDINFYPRFQDLSYLTIASVPLGENGDTQSVKREMFLGSGSTVYASPNNIFVAAPHYEYNEMVRYEPWSAPVTRYSTKLLRFALQNGGAEYSGQGTVPGTLLNQFSMDEHNGYFRVATTVGEVWDSENPSKNNLYVLSLEDMRTVGKIESIAPGERIYSVRFIGNRAYMVTFKKVDPFFVIDVSRPTDPKILGALKIPGFSDYLHPYDENHIIGIGKDTVAPEGDEWPGMDFTFEWYQGMKLALFDVTDVANPKQQFVELIGDRGTDSELLYNHKAFLFDKTKNLLAFPVTVMEIPNKEEGQYTGSGYGSWTFQGAYVYNLDLENGFRLKGKITHIDDPQTYLKAGYYWYNDSDSIQRIMYIGENFYTVSPGKVKATDMETMEAKKTIELEKGPEDEEPMYFIE